MNDSDDAHCGVYGSAQGDVINGNDDNDNIRGWDGDDTISGGMGSDYLSGGLGADTFVFFAEDVGTGSDTLWDFSLAEGDRLDLRDMLKASPIENAEEWAIHDYEGFGGIRISEYEGFERVSQLAAFIAEHGEIGAALLDYYSGDLDEALDDRHLGAYASLADYVLDVTEETTAIPQSLRYYIDWQAMARDAELSGELFTIQTAHDAVHVSAGC